MTREHDADAILHRIRRTRTAERYRGLVAAGFGSDVARIMSEQPGRRFWCVRVDGYSYAYFSRWPHMALFPGAVTFWLTLKP